MSSRAWWLSGAAFWAFTLFVILSGQGPWWILLTPTIFILRLPGFLAARARAQQLVSEETRAIDASHRLIQVPAWVGHAHTPLEFTRTSPVTPDDRIEEGWNEEVYVTMDTWAFRLHGGRVEVQREDDLHSGKRWAQIRSAEDLGLSVEDLDLIQSQLTALHRPRKN